MPEMILVVDDEHSVRLFCERAKDATLEFREGSIARVNAATVDNPGLVLIDSDWVGDESAKARRRNVCDARRSHPADGRPPVTRTKSGWTQGV